MIYPCIVLNVHELRNCASNHSLCLCLVLCFVMCLGLVLNVTFDNSVQEMKPVYVVTHTAVRDPLCTKCYKYVVRQTFNCVAITFLGFEFPNYIECCAFAQSSLLLFVFPMTCLLYTSPSPRDLSTSRMPSSA